jgi:signal transduction histidine kinase
MGLFLGMRLDRRSLETAYASVVRITLPLASKCLLLFGGAVVLSVLAALTVPWLRMTHLIDAGQLDVARTMAITWEKLGATQTSTVDIFGLRKPSQEPWMLPAMPTLTASAVERGGVTARELSVATAQREDDPFLQRALAKLLAENSMPDYQEGVWAGTVRDYRYVKAVRDDATGKLEGVIELNRRSVSATKLLVLNTLYLLVAGALVLLLSMLVFWIITHKLVLMPVRDLRDTAERVREGNYEIRSDIATGDEFEELASTFNSMLNDMQGAQERLRNINAALDLKLHELAETNTALHQTAKVKNDFIANVSHELRTPLNSIIGFAELLRDIASAELEKDGPSPLLAKRTRYLDNILTAGRNLLALINSLLEMARIEAGKIELRIEQASVREMCDGLMGLMQPLADKRGVELVLEAPEDLPMVRTDIRKLQQIVFNFMSNAVKFCTMLRGPGRTPRVVLRAERLAPVGDEVDSVRISVIDNGPGIPLHEQDRIFDKFYQVEGSHVREQSGTGLGLAIAKELAGVLRAELQLVSDAGQGAMFSVIVPLDIDVAASKAAEAQLR